MNIPIPAHEHFALPAPAWLIQTISLLTVWLHLIFVGIVVGTSLLLLYRRLTTRPTDRTLDQRTLAALPVCISLAITFGIGAYLCTQLLHGPYQRTATIFIAPFWLGALAVLLVGFVSTYIARLRLQHWSGALFLLLMPIAFITILYIMTNAAVLTITPEHWIDFHRNRAVIHVPDATTLPRLLHNLTGTCVIAGLAVAWIAPSARTGLRFFLLTLPLQIAAGIWFFFSIPADLRANIGNACGLALICAALAIVTAVVALRAAQPRKWLSLTTAFTLLSLAGMVLTRAQLRTNYLARNLAGNVDLHTAAKTPAMLYFPVIALLTIITLLWLLETLSPNQPTAK